MKKNKKLNNKIKNFYIGSNIELIYDSYSIDADVMREMAIKADNELQKALEEKRKKDFESDNFNIIYNRINMELSTWQLLKVLFSKFIYTN